MSSPSPMQEAVREARKMPAYAGVSMLIDQVLEEVFEALDLDVRRQKVKFQPTTLTVARRIVSTAQRMRVLGASGPILSLADLELPQKKLAGEDDDLGIARIKEMTDPYHADTRSKFTEAAYQDPLLTDGLEKRQGAFFKHGFKLVLKPKKSAKAKADAETEGEAMQETGPEPLQTDPSSAPDVQREEGGDAFAEESAGEPRTPLDKAQGALKKAEQDAKLVAPYEQYVQQLLAWCERPEINLLGKMRTADIASLVQGRTMTLITPGIHRLKASELPASIIVVNTEDIGNPVVDVLTHMIVAVRLNNMGRKFVALPPEIVYIVRKDWGLRKESAFYGGSIMEAVLTISKIYRKLLNYDLAKAIVAGYITKLIIYANVAGIKEENRKTYLKNLVAELAKQGIDITAFEQGSVNVTPIEVKVATDVLKFAKDTVEDILISAAGTTKSQMGRTDGLTRDNATVQEIAFVEYVRVPDEQLIKTEFENQLLNPLLAHLAGTTVDELPVRVEIEREEPADQKKRTAFDSSSPSSQPAVPRPMASADNETRDGRLQAKAEDIEQAGRQDDRDSFKQRGAKNNSFGASAGNRALDLQERAVSAIETLAAARKGEAERYVKPGKS